jgi:hypothetical protein
VESANRRAAGVAARLVRRQQQLAAGGAHNRCWAISRLRWSATLNPRISSTVSPQNSTRTGCSSVGGKTSRMPPRTANSPRRSTSSVRVYAAAASRSTTSSSRTSSPALHPTGASSPSPRGDRQQDRAHRGDHDGQRPVYRILPVRVRQPAQHGQPTAHRVPARTEPLVPQGLPAGEGRYPVASQQGSRALRPGRPPRATWP